MNNYSKYILKGSGMANPYKFVVRNKEFKPQRVTKEEKQVEVTKEVDTIEVLRKEYLELSGKEADKRWKEERLQDEIYKLYKLKY